MKNILFTTGGTGGHIYPALAIADEMKKRGYNIVFVGTKYRMEKDLIPSMGYKFIGLDIIPIKSIKGMYKLIKGIFASKKILKQEKIDAIISFGNYISLPSCIAGSISKTPIYIQEQNIDFGMANKFMKKKAKKIFLAFEKTKEKYNLNDDNIIVSGNPLRNEFYNSNNINEDSILITGGSLGARNINLEILKNIEILSNKGLNIYWSTGKNNYDEIIQNIDKKYLNNEKIKIAPYFDDMCDKMKRSKLVICRAGALTISELIQLQKPSILIPYDYVGQNKNADMLVENGSAYKYSNENIDKAIEKLNYLLDSQDELIKMKKNISKLNLGNAVDKIVSKIVGDFDGN